MSSYYGYGCPLDPLFKPSRSVQRLRYYNKEIARVVKNIKRTYRSLYEADLKTMKPELLGDEKFRRFHKLRSRCKPLDILGLLDTQGFYVVPMAGDSQEIKNSYITAIIGVCLLR